MYALTLADIDEDGRTEIIAGSSKVRASPGASVYAIDGRSGVVEWQRILDPAWDTKIVALEVADVDADDMLDVVASLDHVYVVDAGISP